jgi:hypothetical protein
MEEGDDRRPPEEGGGRGRRESSRDTSSSSKRRGTLRRDTPPKTSRQSSRSSESRRQEGHASAASGRAVLAPADWRQQMSVAEYCERYGAPPAPTPYHYPQMGSWWERPDLHPEYGGALGSRW